MKAEFIDNGYNNKPLTIEQVASIQASICEQEWPCLADTLWAIEFAPNLKYPNVKGFNTDAERQEWVQAGDSRTAVTPDELDRAHSDYPCYIDSVNPIDCHVCSTDWVPYRRKFDTSGWTDKGHVL